MGQRAEYREREKIDQLVKLIEKISGGRSLTVMEVCGTHAVAVFRHGLKSILPPNIRLVSGPGCPVCVTPVSAIDQAVVYARQPDTILATYGDMMKIPGSQSSLLEEKAKGCDVRIVLSAMDPLQLAADHPQKRVIFWAAGFETTAPTVAAAILMAEKMRLKNFYLYSLCKQMPPVLHALVAGGEVNIDGILCPGHVSAVAGTEIYQFLPRDFALPCVVAGFEAADILESIALLAAQIIRKKPRVINQYLRAVRPEGNPKALKTLYSVFEPADTEWRGLGTIPRSGLKLREKYRFYDAQAAFPMAAVSSRERPGCLCGRILRGLNTPGDCSLFAVSCTPDNPAGPCMVSSEGTCATHLKYRGVI
ncbi:hydrogenase formation protein HypD [Desulforamulus ruminis]|uniref:Hydrogenase expression/formation protein HypD n=1 Tax=Desulforamulus ruminis (strain ATCC 23193 / DSM 2154 / NCIMB 8452 / DL) TaxID=696281 RepID=F6DME1_DESRL|nr:hydrogenase formation protein HypD [Desulforamulus ruminis]AEG60608.1 hydrogenase expression/formation protein HypD [Desulforamulus ruminis DSM 2154]